MTIEQKIKYTIIDEYPLFRVGIGNFLSEYTWFEPVDAFGDLRSALNAKKADNPDIIITELVVQRVNILSVVAELCRRFAGCRVLVYTQYGYDIEKLKKYGVHGCLPKTADEELADAILTIVNGGTYFKMMPGPDREPSPKHHYTDDISIFNTFTSRQLQVARLINQHLSSAQIAEKLNIKLRTVQTHRKHIRKKLNKETNKEFYDCLQHYFSYTGAYELQE